MDEMITVRVAMPEDAEAVKEVSDLAVAILCKTYRPKKAANANRPQRTSSRVRLVALMDDRVVGTVEYAIEEDRIHLMGLFVHPQFQRQGVARQLIEYLVSVGQREGVRCLSIGTVKETGNMLIFEKLGFEAVFEGEDQRSESDRYERLTDVYMEMQIERSLPH
jgi:GNAT superfamily N-acetyltransferase